MRRRVARAIVASLALVALAAPSPAHALTVSDRDALEEASSPGSTRSDGATASARSRSSRAWTTRPTVTRRRWPPRATSATSSTPTRANLDVVRHLDPLVLARAGLVLERRREPRLGAPASARHRPSAAGWRARATAPTSSTRRGATSESAPCRSDDPRGYYASWDDVTIVAAEFGAGASLLGRSFRAVGSRRAARDDDRPRPPYSLALSAGSGATRRGTSGTASSPSRSRPEAGRRSPACGSARRRPRRRARSAEPEEALDRCASCSPQTTTTRPSSAGSPTTPDSVAPSGSLRGLRPLRTATVTHSLLKAVCGQLIQARAARLLEARLIRTLGRRSATSSCRPRGEPSAGWRPRSSPARGSSRGRRTRSSACRASGTSSACAGSRRPRPWPASSGARARALVGGDGLPPRARALRAGPRRRPRPREALLGLLGRRAEPEDTRRLLEPYDEWAGLASVYLLAKPA